jgi:hypothetical protein
MLDKLWDAIWALCWVVCFAMALTTAIFHPGRQQFIWVGVTCYGLAFLFALYKFHYGTSVLQWYIRKHKKRREWRNDPNNWSV